ncbi:asparagine synthase (glutamine-hydrolyzing) [Polynucleobacter sp. 73C-SIWE]|uniref:asparagine synthase (glutamine-hydrolyzing) n=1 Tax=Polynucleobacter sp. 73C-SIWE TaxID=2689098 RepID=UPI001C0AEC6E|nr:asparagine synthase (glutamine-hydrolyzing) [Polynucleobacter sp. 73C-SIWE]MBU3578642.1 asparagine synthase (glutamine-hydrolyzing) [Polynucleobacter sp. 73C-SIWE]
MCAISGVYGGISQESVRRMLDAQVHRGPDDCGVISHQNGSFTFGHRRLSIIDTSSAGHQPMSYAEGRLWITFNGEIYNYKELRSELNGYGYNFLTDADTEVILAAYCEWGVECIKRLRGMFAFALCDTNPPKNSPSFIMARDRLGIKPLIYCQNNKEIWFASELRGLRASNQVSSEINSDALLDYLYVGAINQPRTILNNAVTLMPGHWLEIRNGVQRVFKYWDLHNETSFSRHNLINISKDDAIQVLRAQLKESARFSLIADVEIGAFLSGGIDSTAVVGLMGSASGKKIKTFAVGFEGGDEAFDELGYARLASSYLDTDHEEIIVSTGDVENIFLGAIKDIDQPSIDGTNTWIVSRSAGKVVKVAMTGMGGDELFAGYEHFKWLSYPQIFSRLEPTLLAIESLHKLRPNFLTEKLLFGISSRAQRFSMLRRVLQNFEMTDAVRPEWLLQFRERIVSNYKNFLVEECDDVQGSSYAEINGYLLNTLLRDGDVMSMAHGLEVRPLLLDHPLVELAYSLPSKYKLNNLTPKDIFAEAVKEYLPKQIRSRVKKGFELPFMKWMSGPLRLQFEYALNTKNAKEIFLPAYLEKLRGQLLNGRPPRALWAWGILLHWMEAQELNL